MKIDGYRPVDPGKTEEFEYELTFEGQILGSIWITATIFSQRHNKQIQAGLRERDDWARKKAATGGVDQSEYVRRTLQVIYRNCVSTWRTDIKVEDGQDVPQTEDGFLDLMSTEALDEVASRFMENVGSADYFREDDLKN